MVVVVLGVVVVVGVALVEVLVSVEVGVAQVGVELVTRKVSHLLGVWTGIPHITIPTPGIVAFTQLIHCLREQYHTIYKIAPFSPYPSH